MYLEHLFYKTKMELYLEFCTAKNDIHAHVFPDFNFSIPTHPIFHFGVIKNKYRYETEIEYSRQNYIVFPLPRFQFLRKCFDLVKKI